MARNTAFALLLLGSLCIAGCGGSSSGGSGSGSGGSGGGGGTQKTTPTISAWPTASAINYGQTLASSTLTGGTASVPGTFAWTTPSTVPALGTDPESVTFTPTDMTDYNTVAGSVAVTVDKATPAVSAWPTASAINYGQTLASSTLTGGTASTSGTFTWTSPSTAPSAGTPSESITFTPNDTTDYNTAAGSVAVTVNKATPAVSAWPTASAITPGQTLASSTLTGGTASVPGTFAWTTPSTVPATGTDSESVTFTPTDATDYVAVTGSISVSVGKTTPTITWTAPAAITYGTALSGTQLNATASIAGTFVYNPAAGTVLTAGTEQLSTTFTPTDTTDYNTATKGVQIVVNPAVPTITTLPTASAITSGQALSASTLSGGTASVPGMFAWTSPSTVPATGTDSESVTFTPTDTTDYNSVTTNVQIVVNPGAIQLTSISPVAQWCVGQCGFPAFFFNGTNFAAGQLTVCTPDPNIQTVALISATQAEVILGLGSINEGSGYRTCKVCKGDGTGCSASVPLGLYSQNMCASATSGETFCLNPQEVVAGSSANGYVDKFKPDGTPDGKFFVGMGHCCIAVDNVTGFVLVDKNIYAEDGISGSPEPQFQPEPVVANAAENGMVFVVQPTAPNNVSFSTITDPKNLTPPVMSANVGTNPQSLAIMVMGGKTYVDVLTAGSAPALWSVDTTNVTNITSQPVTGVTANLPGGSAITVFDSLGVGIVTSFGDNLAIPFSLTTLEPTGDAITLPGIPVSAVADTVNGIAVIGNADQPNAGGTLTEVDPIAGTATLVPSVETTVLPVGTVPATTGKGFLVCPQDGVSSCSAFTLP